MMQGIMNGHASGDGRSSKAERAIFQAIMIDPMRDEGR
jgi:hypothetical protein